MKIRNYSLHSVLKLKDYQQKRIKSKIKLINYTYSEEIKLLTNKRHQNDTSTNTKPKTR